MADLIPGCRVGVDIGGTFTDIVVEAGDALHSTKLLTDHAAPDRAILTGLQALLAANGLSPARIGSIIHGTTLATNALIERRGARTAFVTTEGFRDVLEMRTENRFEQYDLDIRLPPPLIARRDRFVVRERTAADGTILIPLDEAQLAAVAADIVAGGYASVAIGFLHSYANPAHEERARSILVAIAPHLSVSLSAEVSPQIREFERFNTVCANAYVQAAIKAYLDRLVAGLAGIGITAPVYMMHSGDGIFSLEDAARFPIRLVESGPAGGAIFAASLAARHGFGSVVSFDMGGTTAKICLIEDQKPKTARTFEVARTYRFKRGSGMPISIPVIDMVEIGAGGGSIASVDSLRRVRVGPLSAGSEPGPACYDRGGTSATVTDADLLLGKIDPSNFAGGAICLSRDAAELAVDAAVGQAIALSSPQDAFAICEVVDENMANAGRAHAVESGKTLPDFTMITFGGAGPLHAARFCEKTDIAAFLVPPSAGVGSAVGFLRAPFGYETVRSAVMRVKGLDSARATAMLDDMVAECRSFVLRGADGGDLTIRRTAFMRYVGQGWDIPVDLPTTMLSEETLLASFAAAYARFFGREVEGLDVEIVSWAVKAGSPRPAVERLQPVEPARRPEPLSRRPVYEATVGGFVDADVFERSALRIGDIVDGPAIVTEPETATLLTQAFSAVVQRDGALLARRRQVTS